MTEDLCGREAVFQFIAGNMERIRDSIPDYPVHESIKKPDGTWQYILPNPDCRRTVHDFKLEAAKHLHALEWKKLLYKNGKNWTVIAHVRNETEAENSIELFLRGVNP